MLKSCKYLLIPCALVINAAFADTQVLQYNSTTDKVTSFTIPLDSISFIVSNGKFAWAVKTDDNGLTTSVFNGSSWSQPQNLSASVATEVLSPFNTFVDGNNAIATFEDNSGTTSILAADSSGNYSWQNLDTHNYQPVAGRFWQINYDATSKTYSLSINDKLDQTTFTPLTDKNSQSIVKTISQNGQGNFQSLQYYDKNNNMDLDYIITTNNPSASIEFSLCKVSHNSSTASQQATCSAIKDINLNNKEIDAAVSITSDGKLWLKYNPDTSHSVIAWSSDNGSTWQQTTPFNNTSYNNKFNQNNDGRHILPYTNCTSRWG